MNAPAPRGWLALTAVLALAALGGWWLPRSALDWQPALAAREPWRALTAVAVHYSALHLGANLAGAALVGALGVAARVPRAFVLAWLAAWPLTQFGLLLRPDLPHYGGLSGVLHAGVTVAALWLLARERGRRQLVGAALLAALLLKILGESPWGPAVQARAGWDIAIAPFAHASGAVCGLLCARLALLFASPAHHAKP
ncbi:rhombosortase [Piscinibacter sp.]|uniref:rhombosortase n=1 Tax=Piscinibacter sp. TaxID=1903157 RepID=UPI0039E6FAEC